MIPEEELPKRIKFVYKQSDDYKIIYANGIHGGPTTRGELKFDLFHEYNPPAESETHKVEEHGGLGDKIKPEGPVEEATVIRERKIGVVLSLQHARSIAEWILQRIDEFEEMRKESMKETLHEEGHKNTN